MYLKPSPRAIYFKLWNSKKEFLFNSSLMNIFLCVRLLLVSSYKSMMLTCFVLKAVILFLARITSLSNSRRERLTTHREPCRISTFDGSLDAICLSGLSGRTHRISLLSRGGTTVARIAWTTSTRCASEPSKMFVIITSAKSLSLLVLPREEG